MKIAELFAYIGVVTDEQKLKDFNNLLNEGKSALLNVAAAAVGTSLTFGAMFDKALNTSLALARFTAQTGLSAQTLQLWQHAGEAVGLTAETVTSSITALNTQLAAVRYGGGNVAPYAALGINPGEDAWGVLAQLRKVKASGAFSPQNFSYWVSQMGLSTEMVMLLQLTNKEFDKLSNRDAVITPREMDSLLKFNAALRETGEDITKVFTQLSAEFAPSMTATLADFNRWFSGNRENMSRVIEEIGKWTRAIANEAKGAIDQINRIASATGGWNTAVVALGASLALMHPEFALLVLLIDALNELNTFTIGKGSWDEKLYNFMSGKGGIISQAVGVPGRLGEWMGENQFRGLGQNLGYQAGMGMSQIILSPQSTFHVYGSSDPKATADIVKQHLDHVINNAAGQIPAKR